jgi:uncharacterized membrane protein YphA (DoxX/SURF4 family)
MSTDDFSGMIDLIVFAFGVYILYSGITMKQTGEIKGGMLLPKGIEPRHCKDSAGYITFIYPRMILVGIASLICGAIGLMVDYLQLLPAAVYMVVMLLFLVLLIWYSVTSRKAIDQYWGINQKKAKK